MEKDSFLFEDDDEEYANLKQYSLGIRPSENSENFHDRYPKKDLNSLSQTSFRQEEQENSFENLLNADFDAPETRISGIFQVGQGINTVDSSFNFSTLNFTESGNETCNSDSAKKISAESLKEIYDDIAKIEIEIERIRRELGI